MNLMTGLEIWDWVLYWQ